MDQTKQNKKYLENIFVKKDFSLEIISSNKAINKKSIFINLYLCFILLVLSIIGAYYYTENHRKDELNQINNKIDMLFRGYYEIYDYKNTSVKGELTTPYFNSFRNFERNNNQEFPKDNEGKELYEYYECTSGGWSILLLQKESEYSFSIRELYSENMGFKVPEYKIEPGIDYGYYKSPDYKIPTYRGSVNNAYNNALEYVLKEDISGHYVSGNYDRILYFGNILDDMDCHFYQIETSKHKPINSFCIYNSYWIVWYCVDNNCKYNITIDKDNYNKILLNNLAVAVCIAILIFIFLQIIIKR